jgi:alkylhydroperoxidase family enzyme
MRDALAPLAPATPRPPGGPRGLNVLGTFAHHPDLAAAFFVFNGYILNRSRLTQRQTELVVLQVAQLCDSTYEWKQHVYAARACGITDGEIAAIETGDTAHAWEPADGALLAAVRDLVRTGTLGDEAWTALSESMDAQQVLDVVYTAGTYQMLAVMFSVAGTPLDADLV